MKHLLKAIDHINKVMEVLEDIDEYYFGKLDNHGRKFKDGQFGYYDIYVGHYDDEYTFHPYDDQEKMKTLFNALNIIRRDFSEQSLKLHKSATEKIEYKLRT